VFKLNVQTKIRIYTYRSELRGRLFKLYIEFYLHRDKNCEKLIVQYIQKLILLLYQH